jgi:hypothetical protein
MLRSPELLPICGFVQLKIVARLASHIISDTARKSLNLGSAKVCRTELQISL